MAQYKLEFPDGRRIYEVGFSWPHPDNPDVIRSLRCGVVAKDRDEAKEKFLAVLKREVPSVATGTEFRFYTTILPFID